MDSTAATFKQLKSGFETKYQDLRTEFEEKHSESLTWLREKGIDVEALPTQAAKGVATGAAAGVMLLSSGVAPSRELPSIYNEKELPGAVVASAKPSQDKSAQIRKILAANLPKEVRPLTASEEKKISGELSALLGFKVVAQLQGRRLNTNYGYIGTESHLTRYPGDNLSTHFDSAAAADRYAQSGWAGGRGAFGYFARDSRSLTADLIQQEKYYLVVQTFASPGWGKPGVYEWFKQRKFLVVNPNTGKTVVGVLGDSGPAISTGKQYGGSPEVMDALGLYPPRAQQGVLFLFVDEGSGKIEVGPK